jgi:hypothetical protein
VSPLMSGSVRHRSLASIRTAAHTQGSRWVLARLPLTTLNKALLTNEPTYQFSGDT